MRMTALSDAKNLGFFKIYGVSARTRGEGRLSQCGHFSDKGEGVDFSRLCGQPLMLTIVVQKGKLFSM